VKAKVDLGGSGTLYVGTDGLRRLVHAADLPVEAQTLTIEDFVGVLRDEKGQVLFVASDGAVFAAHEPLGPLEALHPGPFAKPGSEHAAFSSITTGRAAILGVTRDGHVLRSADAGTNWHPLAYAGAGKHYGRAASAELDSEGNGLVLHYPQRLFVTHDDGATWAPIASPGIGARSVLRDGAGQLWLIGRRERARLEGGAFRVTDESPAPLYVAPPNPNASAEAKEQAERGMRRNVRRLLSGDRVIEFAEIYRHGRVREVEVSSAALGDARGKPVVQTSLVSGSQNSYSSTSQTYRVAGFGKELVYLRQDDDADPSAPTTTLFRSQDYGETWHDDGALKGAEQQERDSVGVAVGPGGWTYVASLCPRYSPEGRTCAHQQIKKSGSVAFEDMVFNEELTPTGFAFDAERDRVYAVGIHNGRKYAYESPLSQNRWIRLDLFDAASSATTAITVDDQGTLRVLEYDGGKHAWVLHRRSQSGDKLPALYVPIERGTLAFAGSRGLLFRGGREAGWETADGGETWTRIGGVTAAWLMCSSAGCLDDDGAERVGWDLPVAQGDERISAMTELPKAPSATPPPAVADPIEVVCKGAGATSTVSAVPGTEMVDGRTADVRWATLKHDADGKTAIVFGSRAQLRETQLLPAAPKPAKPVPGKPTTMVNSGDKVLNDGVVAARYKYVTEPDGRRGPVDVELTWWSAATGKTHHHELTKLESFYVSSWSFTGTPQIVDGGLLFQPTYKGEAYFVHDDGKVEKITIPSGTSVRNAERVGKGWLLAESNTGSVELLWSSEGGKEWSRREWGLESTGTSLMALIDGKATVSFSAGSLPTALFTVGASPANDPPPPVVIDAAAVSGACDAHAATLRATSYVPSDERRFRARMDAAKDDPQPTRLSIYQRVTHSTASGSICTSAYILTGYSPKTYDSETAFLYPESKGLSGWWFRRVPDPKDATKRVVVAGPITCEAGTDHRP
jgi:hypothetical protein